MQTEDKTFVLNLLECVVKLTKFLLMFTESVFPGCISYKCDPLNSKDLNETNSQFGLSWLQCERKFLVSFLIYIWIMNFHHSSFTLNYERVLFADYYGEKENIYVRTHTLM